MVWPILAVQDFDQSAAFYQKLGFKVDMSLLGKDGRNAFGGISFGKASFGLSLVDDLEHRGNGVSFMLYIPDELDLDEYYAQVKAQGIKIAEEIQTQYWGDRTFAVHDPDGYYISLCKTVKQVPMEEIESVMRGEKQTA